MNPDYNRQFLKAMSETPLTREELTLKLRVHRRTANLFTSNLSERGMLEQLQMVSQAGKKVKVFRTTEKGRHVLQALELLA